MLRSCLDLIPVEVENAQSTLDVATRLLGPGGLWKSRDELVPGITSLLNLVPNG